jgi:predicted anti-sigma-YlaC factor YlaD
MNCKVCHGKLIPYLEGTLPDTLKEGMETHLRECPDCAGFARYLEESLRVISLEKEAEPRPFLFTRIKAKMGAAVASPVRSSWSIRLQPALFSLLLVMAIFMGVKMGDYFSAPRKSDFISANVEIHMNEMPSEKLEMFLMD